MTVTLNYVVDPALALAVRRRKHAALVAQLSLLSPARQAARAACCSESTALRVARSGSEALEILRWVRS